MGAVFCGHNVHMFPVSLNNKLRKTLVLVLIMKLSMDISNHCCILKPVEDILVGVDATSIALETFFS